MIELQFLPTCNGAESYFYSSVFFFAIIFGLRLRQFGWYSICVNLLPFAFSVYIGLFARNFTAFLLGNLSANLLYAPLYVTVVAYLVTILFHALNLKSRNASTLKILKASSLICSASFFLTAIDMCVLLLNDFRGG